MKTLFLMGLLWMAGSAWAWDAPRFDENFRHPKVGKRYVLPAFELASKDGDMLLFHSRDPYANCSISPYCPEEYIWVSLKASSLPGVKIFPGLPLMGEQVFKYLGCDKFPREDGFGDYIIYFFR